MAKTIQVYIMNKKVTTRESLDGSTQAAAAFAHSRTHDCSMKEVPKTEKVISKEDEAALKLVEEIATEKNIRFQVIDVAGLKGKLRARLKGVKTTPTIIVGNNRLLGVPQKKEIEPFLRADF